MSFETDAPIRTLCEACQKFVETEGYGIPAWVMSPSKEVFHAKCAPAFCTHERSTVMDWESSDSDTVLYRMKCRDCGLYWTDEILGAQLRAEGEQENDTE